MVSSFFLFLRGGLETNPGDVASNDPSPRIAERGVSASAHACAES